MDEIVERLLKKCLVLSGDTSLQDTIIKLATEGLPDDAYVLIHSGTNEYSSLEYSLLKDIAKINDGDTIGQPIESLTNLFHQTEEIDSPGVKEIRSLLDSYDVEIIVVSVTGKPVGVISRSSFEDWESSFQGIINKITTRWDENPFVQILAIIVAIFTVYGIVSEFLPFFSSDTKLMTGEWNVAVAGFTPQGNEKIKRESSTLISSVFFNRLETDLQELANEIDVIVQVLGPEDIKIVKGNNAEERENNAEILAERINADIIIYGTITRSGNSITIQPEFYVAARNFYEAEEMTGQHALGEKITITEVDNRLTSQVNLNRDLSDRAQALSLVTRGLTEYFIHAYDDAFLLFQEANQDDLWASDAGREVVYLFLGNAAGKSLQLDIAEEAYTKAIELQPEYSRGYVGLGNIAFLKSLSDSSSGPGFQPNWEALDLAEYFFKKAMESSLKPSSADISTKVAFGLGQIRLIQWYAGNDTLEDAINQFTKVIEEFGNGNNPRVQEFASESHLRLGLIYRDQDQEKAIENISAAAELATNSARRGLHLTVLADLYQKADMENEAKDTRQHAIEDLRDAISLTDQNNLKALYWENIAIQYENLGEISKSIDAYENAIEEIPQDQDAIGKYQEKIKDLKQGN